MGRAGGGRSCEDWHGHVIVCGLHGVGVRTVEQLHLAEVRVVVVDDAPNPQLTKLVDRWGVRRIKGSPRQPETLTEAGVAGAAAVICVLADDLHTMEAALLARELCPGVRVVVAIRNPAVGRALAGIDVAVLDVAGLSAPSVAEACLRTGAHDLDLAGERFVTATVPVDGEAPGTLRDAFGDLTPVAVSPTGGGDLVVCPGRDSPIAPGDRVTVLGTPQELAAAGVAPRGGGARGRPGWRSGGLAASLPRGLAASLLSLSDRRLRIALGCLVALFAVATGVLRAGYREPDGTRMSVLDAAYFTVETIATVGYGDFNFRQQPYALRIFAIVLMVLGAIGATVFFALLTNTFVTQGIAEALGRRLATEMSGHVIVVGLGSIGVRVVELLRAEGSEVVVVDRDEGNRYAAQVRALGARLVVADGTLPQTLRAVNLAGAAAVAVLTSDDLVNLETALAVRDQLGERWSSVPVVLRLFDRQLVRTVRRNFGFRWARSTAELAAPWFVGAALGLDVLGTFYVADQLLLVGRLTVAAGSGLDGLAMADLSARIRVVAISRAAEGGRLEYPPRRGTRLRGGDRAYLVGPYRELLRVLRRDPAPPGGGAQPYDRTNSAG